MNVSVVLPFYHKAELFKLALAHTSCYHHPGFELVCVLDCPEDEIPVVDLAHANADCSFRIIVNDVPHPWRPPCVPLNVGIRHATAEHVLIASPETILKVSADYLISLAAENFRQLYAGLLWHVGDLKAEDSFDVTERKLIECEAINSPVQLGNGFLLAPRLALMQICGFDERRKCYGGDDDDVRLRLARLGQRMVVEPQIKVFHQFHPTQGERALSKELPSSNIVLEHQRETWGKQFSRVAWDYASKPKAEVHELEPGI